MRIRFTEPYDGKNSAGIEAKFRVDQCVACPAKWGNSIVKKGKAEEMGGEEILKEVINENEKE